MGWGSTYISYTMASQTSVPTDGSSMVKARAPETIKEGAGAKGNASERGRKVAREPAVGLDSTDATDPHRVTEKMRIQRRRFQTRAGGKSLALPRGSSGGQQKTNDAGCD